MSKKLRLNHAYKAALLMTTGLVMIGCSSNPEPRSNMTQAGLTSVNVSVDKTQKQNMEWARMMRVADRAWLLNDHDTALRLYRNANQARPSDLRPLMGMAEILRKTNRGQMAINIYNAALQAHPDNADIHTGLGYSLLSLDKPFMATKSFQKALDLEADNSKALGGIAVALDTAGEHERAHAYYRQAIRQAPENLTYQSNLGLSLALSGHTDEAIALLERVTASPKATAKHRQNLALVYGLAGKSQEAMRYSRMDLSKRDSRNNQLYFQALNGTETQNNFANVAPAEPKEQTAQVGIEKKTRPASHNILGTGPKEPVTLAAVQQTTALKANPPMTGTGTPRQLKPVAPKTPEYRPSRPDSSDIVLADSNRENSTDGMKNRSVAKAENQAIANLAVREEFLQAELAPEPAKPGRSTFSTAVSTEMMSKPTEEARPRIQEASVPDIPVMQPKTMTKSQGKAYFVQLGSYRSAHQARLGWQVLKAKHQYLLTDYNPVIATADLGEDKGGLYYRLRIGGFAQKATPLSLCSDLRNLQTDCFMPYVIGFDGPILDQPTTAAPAQQLPLVEAKSSLPASNLSADANSAPPSIKSNGFIAGYRIDPNTF